MKLRNKRTGKIIEWEQPISYKVRKKYYSLAELSADWEDYEEPKEYWAIDCFSPDGELVSQFDKCSERIIENRKQIGNYFETKEEAEEAVEMLKAWKRLKDKGFKFLGVRTEALVIDYDIPKILYMSPAERKELYEDLRFVFGGEE